MEWFSQIVFDISRIYLEFFNTLPTWSQNFLNLFFISLILVLYSIIIWKFYRFIAKKNILELNLNQYNRSEHPFFSKTIKIGFYVLEYVIILPFLIFFWFSMFTIFLVMLTDSLELNSLLIVSATIIVAIRMTSYYKEDLAKDIAKLLPFTLLGVTITQYGMLNFGKIMGQLNQIPTFFEHITSYLLFIFIIEFILRIIEIFFMASGVPTDDEPTE